MSKIREVEELVKSILIDKPETRKDDYILIGEVMKKYHVDDFSVSYVFSHHTTLKLPSLETITRCRRKIQAETPTLAYKRVKDERLENTAEYIRYALGTDYEIL